MRSPPPRASRRRRRRSPRATRGAPRRPLRGGARVRGVRRAGGATTGTAAAARVLLGATLGARREPKASKEAGKILAKATRGAAAGGIGVRAAAEACARASRAPPGWR